MIDMFGVIGWTIVGAFCVGCWIAVFYGGAALLTSLGF